MRSIRGIGALAATAALSLIAGIAASPAAAAAPASITEGFTSATATQAPSGWTVENTNVDGMRAGWQGWSFHTVADTVSTWGASGDRGAFSRADGMTAVVHSDGNRPTTGRFDSVLWAPPLDLSSGTGSVQVTFDSHYKQGQAPQTAQLIARFDGGAPATVESFARNRLNEQVSVAVNAPAGARSVQIGWSYANSTNNWFWMIDDVQIAEAAPADSTPRILSAAKPVAGAGSSVPVKVGGLRPGQQLTASLGADAVGDIPVADAAGETSFSVTVPAGLAPGYATLALGGAGIAPASLDITVLAPADADSWTTEDQLWFDGFEKGTWTATGGWETSSIADVVATYGVDRRQAFTRASGLIAVAESAKNAVDGSLASAPIAVKAGDALELRVDSHYRKRGGAQQGTATVSFDNGTQTVLRTLSGTDEESAQLRLPFVVPAGATSMTVRFAFQAASASGSWMLDNVEIVRPLAPLAGGTQAQAVVDIFSDVQGATARLSQNVLPGFRGMAQKADTIVSNGDLVSNGSASNYAAYLNAFAAGGGGQYDTVVSTMGNHEYYGSEGSATFQNRFLDSTGMRAIGGQGGLWGEVLVDGALPLIWIGSEFYDYNAQTGSGPFVDLSNAQYAWLRDRLDHWRAQNKPVLLFSHHLLPYSVSGSYARFYSNDYGQDAARFEALLSRNPNVIMFNSHTHWSPTLNDWSAQLRTDPTQAHAPTVVNTGAVTTMYGPSGDWDEKAIGGADPTGVRAALYDDRVRVSVYSFSTTGATEIKHVDVPLPTEQPVQPADPAIEIGAESVVAGGQVTISGTGFPASTDLAIELRSTPVRIGKVTTDAVGAFTTSVTIPKDTPAGAHTLAVIAPSGTEVTAAITVTAATGGGGGTGGTDGTDAGSGAPKPDGGLASTGAEPVWMLLAGALTLIVAGGAIVLRRRAHRG